ncbi:RidA family protein [Novipirellula artificiosorum]|uniref:Putative aminoacrylate peracid reductase RutC n=1 Tax=Novipirellula artificiosorum TaxID=2528016 RepID=A0A5C6DIU2_9BACT|nr:RidA family protein [Novipirellula artificiosorum]TWU36014.1 putative aminoacrylate peracid reductase RutC [Novipirellula artificiosorum]
MNESIQRTATAGSQPSPAGAEAVVCNSPDASICHRMQPMKQMLTSEGCSGGCQLEALASENKMPACLLSDQQHTVIHLDGVCRVALMVTPQASGSAVDQAWEAISTIRVILKQQSVPMTVTMQTVFVRSAEEIPAFAKLFAAYFGDCVPATSFIVQPPCGGQALAIEAWALGGDDVKVQFPLPDVVTIDYHNLRWIYLGGICPLAGVSGAFDETTSVFEQLVTRLGRVNATFKDVPRVWLYQGNITDPEQGIERYRELNRSRTDFFDQLQAEGRMTVSDQGHVVYPASTGIGMTGGGLTLSGMALQTDRKDVRLISLENPQQTSAFEYAKSFSVKSPKFARAMAVMIGEYATIWVSGTASILDSESVHLDDIEKQTEQTIDNIEQLISPTNCERHGLSGVGAELSDLAKVRVYVKRPEDFEKCRAVCERRFGALPTIYAFADVCRPELLVEIEGVAFAKIK